MNTQPSLLVDVEMYMPLCASVTFSNTKSSPKAKIPPGPCQKWSAAPVVVKVTDSPIHSVWSSSKVNSGASKISTSISATSIQPSSDVTSQK